MHVGVFCSMFFKGLINTIKHYCKILPNTRTLFGKCFSDHWKQNYIDQEELGDFQRKTTNQ